MSAPVTDRDDEPETLGGLIVATVSIIGMVTEGHPLWLLQACCGTAIFLLDMALARRSAHRRFRLFHETPGAGVVTRQVADAVWRHAQDVIQSKDETSRRQGESRS